MYDHGRRAKGGTPTARLVLGGGSAAGEMEGEWRDCQCEARGHGRARQSRGQS